MKTLEYIRHFRIFEYAIFDIAVTFLGMYLISGFLSKLFLKINIDIPKNSWLFFALPIGVIIHLIFGKITPMTKNFVDLHGHYILKIVIMALFIIGLIGIKIVK
jgi:hypothetical protein